MPRAIAPGKPTPPPPVVGQHPLGTWVMAWILLLITLWAANSVMIKVVLRDIPPLWAAFLRFGGALPFIAWFILRHGNGLRVTPRQFGLIAIIGLTQVLQIALFNLGSQWTTGGRVTLFLYAYPLFVPVLAHWLLHQERLRGTVLTGCVIAFLGLIPPLWDGLRSGGSFRGDLCELGSGLVLALQIVINKRLIHHLELWRVFFWQQVLVVGCFLALALGFEHFQPAAVGSIVWAALLFQILVVSVFSFLSYQWLLSRHNSAGLSVCFFATPLVGMGLCIVLLGEPFDLTLLLGSLLVGIGIWLVNRRRTVESPSP